MNLVASLIKLMFGTKSEKDRKLIAPYVEKILYVRAAPRSKRPSPTISARTSSRSPI